MKTKLFIGMGVLAIVAAFAGASAGQSGPQAQAVPGADKEAILRTAMDYAEGYFSGAAERMERAIHYDLNKVYVDVIPQTGKKMLGYSTFSGLVEATRAKMGLLDPEKRKLAGSVLGVNGDVACAKITSSQFNDFLLMVRFEGQWKIVNVLWVPGPDAEKRPIVTAYAAAMDDPGILAAARDLIEGMFSGDAARVEKAVHPEVSVAMVGALPSGKTAILRSRLSGLVEPVRAKIRIIPEASRKADYRIIDVMDGMAFVEVEAIIGAIYLQMSSIDGEWKVINVMTRRAGPPPAAKK